MRSSRPRLRATRLWIGALLLAGACGGGGSGTGDLAIERPSPDGLANDALPVLAWTAPPSATAFRVTLRLGGPDGELIEEQDVEGHSTAATVPLPDGAEIHLRVEAVAGPGGSARSRFRVRIAPDDFPRYGLASIDRRHAEDGYFLLNVQDPLPPNQDGRIAGAVLLNGSGEILWWLRREEPGFLTDLRLLDDGTLLYIERPNEDEPRVVRSTWDGTDLWRSRPGAYPHHEAGPGPDGGVLYLTTLLRDVDGETWEGDGLELADPITGEVMWSWDIFDHVSTDEVNRADLLLPGVALLGADWTHSNGAVWDEARSAIWVSVRNLDRMLLVDYPGGAVRRVFGDGGLGGAALMSHQHAPEIQADGSVLFYDNGNTRFPPSSRVSAFRWDEATDTLTESFAWAPGEPIFDPAVGDADRLPNGNVLVVSGTTGLLAQKPASLIELTPEGRVVRQLDITDGFRLIGFWIYRAEHVPADRVPPELLPFPPAP